MGDDVIISVISLIIGSMLACVSGILVNKYYESEKEKKQYNAFLLEFRLNVNRLHEHIGNYQNVLKTYGPEFITYHSTHLVKNSVFHDYKMISEIPGIDIEKYYELISVLEKIDIEIDRPYTSQNGKSSINPVVFIYYQNLKVPYLNELKELLSRLK